MDAAKQMGKDVKKYDDTADDETGWWDEIPDDVNADVEEAIRQADKGETIPHTEVKKKYAKWFTT